MALFGLFGRTKKEPAQEAAEQVTAYTIALQTDLQAAGFYEGPIDGIYGPQTVAAVEQLQTEAGLRVTGLVDQATAAALQAKLDELGLSAAAESLRQTTALQTVLTLTGYWTGPIDGVWTDELTQALMDFQTALGVEPTGVVDAATIAAFQQAIANLEPGTPATTAAPAPPTTPSGTTDAPAPGEEATVQVADSDLGQILTNGSGITVYLFMPDAQGAPTCTEACAQSWPPVRVDDESQVVAGEGIDSSLLGTVDHPNAGTQVTYNGWPLYVFTGDAAPGDTNGQGQSDAWYVLDPTGNPIQ